MNYQETIDYLYNTLPMFQNIGGAAINKGLDKTLQLLEILDNPQNKFKTIHIAGTNGKGSTSSMLSAIMQSGKYKTGLYTSPHLKSFTERIKVDGKEIPPSTIVDFVKIMKPSIEKIRPSFFELTVAMAFNYFAQEQVDVAVIEVGMGGRLDSTNVIIPVLSLITNISFDHQAHLGNTLKEIAFEKAGIIKNGVPVIVSEYSEETKVVFEKIANQKNADLYYAQDRIKIFEKSRYEGKMEVEVVQSGKEPYLITSQLTGNYQLKNIPAVILASQILQHNFPNITSGEISEGIARVCDLTGLKGRWHVIQKNPLIVCDTGHNEAGISEIVRQIEQMHFNNLHIVFGVVKDKDISKILSILPKTAQYYFCEPGIPRALPAEELADRAKTTGINGVVEKNVNKALDLAIKKSDPEDLIFVGGSTFVVAEIDKL